MFVSAIPSNKLTRTGIAVAACLLMVTSGMGLLVDGSSDHPHAPRVTTREGKPDSSGSMGLNTPSRVQEDRGPPASFFSSPLDRSTRAAPSLASPVVNDTLVLANDSNVPGNFLAENGQEPGATTYDSAKSEIFVAEDSTEAVAVYNDTTNQKVAWIPLDGNPNALAYDSGKGEIFVVVYGLVPGVTVINDTNNSVVASIPVAGTPDELAYDSAQSEIYVTSIESDDVSVINDTNNTVVTTIAIGGSSEGIAYDSGEDEIWVAGGSGAGAVQVIAARLNTVIHTVSLLAYGGPGALAYVSAYDEIAVSIGYVTGLNGLGVVVLIEDSNFTQMAADVVGAGPASLLYDPDAIALVVLNIVSDNLTVISAISDKVGRSVPLGPQSEHLIDDSGKAELFVCVDGADGISILSDSTFRAIANLTSGASPWAVVYDSGRGEFFVSDDNQDNVTVISAATRTIVATIPVGGTPLSLVYDSGKGEVLVVVWVYPVDNISVISDATDTVVRTIPVDQVVGDFAYDSVAGEIFASDPNLNEVTVISDATDAVVGTLPVGDVPLAIAFDSGTSQLFVANSYGHNVTAFSTLNDTVTGNISVPGPIGLAYDASSSEVFVESIYSGNVTVIADSNDTAVATIPGAGGPQYRGGSTPMVYEAGTDEVFATAGGNGNVTVISDTTHSILEQVEVGQDPTGIAYDPALGTTAVTNYLQGTVSFLYQKIPPPTYPVTFSETGLPTRDSWTVTVAGGLPLSSTGTTISTDEPNGSYAYTVGTVEGYTVTPTAGTVNVSGGSESVNVSFFPIPVAGRYPVTFAESGLPVGTQWGVTLNGSLLTSATPTINFTERNGTLPFRVQVVSEYSATPASGSVTVSGTAASLTITFTSASTGPTNGTGSRSSAGLPESEVYVLVGAVVLAVILGLVVVVLQRRRRKGPPTETVAPPGTAVPPGPPVNPR
jgi:YVTN family beta-propeller protein